ncbi:MAG: type III pantothenate kinase [Proteobacteria bacterium]|nr:type III pantothenate kinase [Pseudomonadota bacterium]
MFLIGDIGNTQSKFALYDSKKNKIKNLITLDSHSIEKNKQFLKLTYNKKIQYIVLTSVVPKVFSKIKKIFSKKKIKCLELLDKKLCNPIKININKPKQVGSDRISNVIAAHNFYNTNCIVVDFGTATTFDILTKKKTYEGGLITPGVRLSLSTLNSLTALLPLVKLKKTSKIIGKDTISAINSGIYWGYVSMINGILEKIISSTKKKYKIILTGGLSYIFSNSLKYKSTVARNLTLWGVVGIINFNKKLFKI